MRQRAVSFDRSLSARRAVGRRALALGLLVFALWGCETGEVTVLSEACHVIADDCSMADSVGECMDAIGGMHPDCIDCIAASGCDYSTCQKLPVGCRLPIAFLPGQ